MAFDTFVLAAVAKELREALNGAKIIKIHQQDRHSIMIKYHGQKGNGRLLLCAHPKEARIQLTQNAKENPQNPPLFCMVLRKYLEGSRITSISQTHLERVLTIELATRNDLGDIVPCRLITEIMGKHSNIILINDQGLIIDGIRRYSHQLSRYREVLPGRPYLPPPVQDKADLSKYDEEKLGALLFAQALDEKLGKALSKIAAGLSPQMVAEAVFASGLSPDAPVAGLGQYELSRLTQSLGRLYKRLIKEDFCPTLLGGNTPRDFAAINPGLWEGEKIKHFTSMNEALDIFYEYHEKSNLFAARQRELAKIIGNHEDRLKKKISLQEEDLSKSERGDAYKEAGDLLSANLYHLPQGAAQVELESFYHPGEMVEIALDPSLPPEQNIKRYYRLYSKCKKAHIQILEQLEANRAELEYIQSVANACKCSSCLDELEEIKDELRQTGYLKEQKKAAKAASAALPPHNFTSAEGFTILVGRNNRQNDKLTLKTAAKDDIWLHTQKIPGSHVIIRTEGRQPSMATIEEAASYAAWFSKASASNNVPVDYTTVDQVKKPNGSRPGFVIYFNQKTVYVEPKKPEE